MESSNHSIQKYLVQRCKKGDRKAQNELYKLHVGAMYNICRRMMGEEEEARDVLQDAFVDAFTKLHNLENEITFAAWLKRIVINKCINAINKKRILTDELNEEIDLPVEEGFENLEHTQEQMQKILKAIDQISEGCKVVLNLYLFEGYDHKEIGQILAISESASKAQYSKAKAKIRKILMP